MFGFLVVVVVVGEGRGGFLVMGSIDERECRGRRSDTIYISFKIINSQGSCRVFSLAWTMMIKHARIGYRHGKQDPSLACSRHTMEG